MPIPSSINDLSTTAGSNSPAGSESPSLIDDYLRTYASYIAALRDGKLDASLANFAILYPNGGTSASPASVALNSRYVETNPFPGFHVICLTQIRLTGNWADPGWIYFSTTGSYGVSANVDGTGAIVVQTGTLGTVAVSNAGGGGHGIAANITIPAPCRVLVWKLRGAL